MLRKMNEAFFIHDLTMIKNTSKHFLKVLMLFLFTTPAGQRSKTNGLPMWRVTDKIQNTVQTKPN